MRSDSRARSHRCDRPAFFPPVHGWRSRLRRVVPLLCLFGFSMPAFACINAIGSDRDGRPFPADDRVGDDLVRSLGGGGLRDFHLRNADEIEADAKKSPDLDRWTALGILRIYQGRYREAANQFLATEATFPGRPETAANLGTALELMGEDAIALRWIRIGIRRNAHEHYGTEWLHARILDAKIGLRKDPTFLDGRSVAGIAFRAVPVPPLPNAYPPGNDGRPVTPSMLNAALHYQLRERLAFVRPKDRVVADLLTDWATLNLSGGPVENAKALYPLAIRYGAPKTPLLLARWRRSEEILERPDRSGRSGVCAICFAPDDAFDGERASAPPNASKRR